MPENSFGVQDIRKYADMCVVIFVRSILAGYGLISNVLVVIQRSAREKYKNHYGQIRAYTIRESIEESSESKA